MHSDLEIQFCVAGLARLASHIATTPANACVVPCAAGTTPLAAAAHLGADAPSSVIIPHISPPFIRDAFPEEEAHAQAIVNHFLAQISPHAATTFVHQQNSSLSQLQ